MQIRKTFIRLFGAPLSVIPVSPLIRITRKRFISPLYHVVSDEKLPHIQHLYAYKNVKAFEKDLDFILKHYSPVGADEVVKSILENSAPERNTFLLTFDDGLRQFHDVAAPILLRKGIPAICFCNSDFIDNRDMFFRYKASVVIDHLQANPKLLEQKNIREWFQTHLHTSVNNYKKALLDIRYAERKLIEIFAALIELNLEDYIAKHQPYLTSQNIISLHAKGFVFGAHSMDHPQYRFLDVETQIFQTHKSVQAIRQLTHEPQTLFAFPFTDDGVSKSFFEKIAQSENAPALTFGCAGLKNDSIASNLQRIPLEVSGRTAKEILTTEYLYYMAKAIINRNIIQRK